jgi:ATP synthase F1 gamma subunit
MAQQIDILKNELHSVQDLGEIANLLEQVAAKDIAHVRNSIIESRPFFQEAWKIYRVLRQVTPLPPTVINRDLVIIITLNWGMVGGLLNRVMQRGEQLYEKYEADVLITGRMGQTRFAERDERTVHFFSVPNKATYEDIEPLKKIIAKYSQVHFVYPRYIKASHQEIETASLTIGTKSEDNPIDQIAAKRFIIEPDVKSMVDYLNQAIIGILLFDYFSESLLAYSAAQMVAMRSAHDNARDEEHRLTLAYHKARRSLIDAKLRELHEARFSKQTDGGEA